MTPNVIPNHILERLWAAGEVGEWRQQALCRGADTRVFFPERGAPTGNAKAVCRRCPVQEQCRAYALAAHERFGTWGGLSERERRRIRRGQTGPLPPSTPPPIDHGTPRGYRSHRRRGEDACDACKAAHAAYQAIRITAGRQRARQAVRDRNTANPAAAELAARAQDGLA